MQRTKRTDERSVQF